MEWSNDGLLFANLGKKLYAVDPDTFEFKYLCDTESFTLGADGNVYYSPSENRTLMYRITINAQTEIPTSIPAKLDITMPSSVFKGQDFTATLKAA